MDTLKYKFVTIQGEKRVEVEKPYHMLSDISNCSSSHLSETVQNLDKVIKGEMDYWSWGGSDYCTIDSAEIESMVFYEFGEKDLVLETKDVFKLVKEFNDFKKSK
ncbi:MAG: hypothetical protein U0V72_09605 [Cytophagales bacterium]